MEKISTKEELLGSLKDLHSVETLARESYVEDIQKFENEKITRVIREIKIDEDKHITLLEEIINLLSTEI